MAEKRETNRVSYYFLKEKKILAITALSGILYNLGLVAVPWFEGHISQYLADILEGTRQPSSLVFLALSYFFTVLFVQAMRYVKRVSVKFSSVIHLTVDDYYLRGFGFISISV